MTVPFSVSRSGSAAEYDGDECGAFVGVAATGNAIRAVLANNEESVYDAMLCDRIPKGSKKLGPYESQGPRMVVLFGSTETPDDDGQRPFGFRAKVEFRTGERLRHHIWNDAVLQILACQASRLETRTSACSASERTMGPSTARAILQT